MNAHELEAALKWEAARKIELKKDGTPYVHGKAGSMKAYAVEVLKPDGTPYRKRRMIAQKRHQGWWVSENRAEIVLSKRYAKVMLLEAVAENVLWGMGERDEHRFRIVEITIGGPVE